MRLIVTLSIVLLLSLNVNAKDDGPVDGEAKAVVVEMPNIISLDNAGYLLASKIDLAILYKMKENIIRRELSFAPRKKWWKWV